MLERVEGFGIELLLVDELGGDQGAENVLELLRLALGDLSKDGHGELPADHRRRLQHSLRPPAEPVDPRGEHGLHTRRHRRLRDRPASSSRQFAETAGRGAQYSDQESSTAPASPAAASRR